MNSNMETVFCRTSNEKLNGPMTYEQWQVVDFVGLEAETAWVYPFAIDFDDMTKDMVDKIVEGCNGRTDDWDTLYRECERVLGCNEKRKAVVEKYNMADCLGFEALKEIATEKDRKELDELIKISGDMEAGIFENEEQYIERKQKIFVEYGFKFNYGDLSL